MTSHDQRAGPVEPGYRSALYAEAFAEFGCPRGVGRSGGWLLQRPIAETGLIDAMGLYPLFCCEDWSALPQDFEESCDGWISATLVTDPLGDYDEALLKRTFDLVIPYKDHFIAETTEPLETFVSKSHRENARRALRKVTVDICEDPMAFVDDWVALYAILARRHGIDGMRAFSRVSFERQLSAPGMVMFRAALDGKTVGLDLWYVDGDIAYGHLAAFCEKGYAASASYATKWTVLNHFADKVRWIDLGGLAGLDGQGANGLAHFKTGWSNMTRRTYICGRIFNEAVYRELARGAPKTAYFPAYRAGEY